MFSMNSGAARSLSSGQTLSQRAQLSTTAGQACCHDTLALVCYVGGGGRQRSAGGVL